MKGIPDIYLFFFAVALLAWIKHSTNIDKVLLKWCSRCNCSRRTKIRDLPRRKAFVEHLEEQKKVLSGKQLFALLAQRQIFSWCPQLTLGQFSEGAGKAEKFIVRRLKVKTLGHQTFFDGVENGVLTLVLEDKIPEERPMTESSTSTLSGSEEVVGEDVTQTETMGKTEELPLRKDSSTPSKSVQRTPRIQQMFMQRLNWTAMSWSKSDRRRKVCPEDGSSRSSRNHFPAAPQSVGKSESWSSRGSHSISKQKEAKPSSKKHLCDTRAKRRNASMRRMNGLEQMRLHWTKVDKFRHLRPNPDRPIMSHSGVLRLPWISSMPPANTHLLETWASPVTHSPIAVPSDPDMVLIDANLAGDSDLPVIELASASYSQSAHHPGGILVCTV
eukprot:GEMP01064074.1.p1 GENE.GEMP01064074.1~~GEMP01064074.1.p1  ORF type:complete len:386 (+),score=65.89 GEMP01064074.1:160-1317(+)